MKTSTIVDTVARTFLQPRWFSQSSRSWLIISLLAASVWSAFAYPPAPHHLFYGMVRDEFGTPINDPNAVIILVTAGGARIKTQIVPGLEPGVNYRLAVPMDSGITSDLYKPTALKPFVPFMIQVVIAGVTNLPIEMTGNLSQMGQPGKRTLLNLTLGEDLNGDGLPDAWQRLINADLSKVTPNGDSDKDGLTNLQEYLAGTYAFDPKDGFSLTIVGFNSGAPLFEFLAIRGRTYTLHGSPDLKTWTAQSFSIPADGATASIRNNYFADTVRKLQIQAATPAGDTPPRFFRLMVQ